MEDFQSGVVGGLTDDVVKCGRSWVSGDQQDRRTRSAEGNSKNRGVLSQGQK